jgi:hypothetical protein
VNYEKFSWEKLFFPPKILKIVDYFLSILHQRGPIQ